MREKCRLCLGTVSGRKGCSITDNKISSILCKVFYFTISRTESNLPDNVCARCLTKIRDFHDYSEVVHSNQEILLQSNVKRENDVTDSVSLQQDSSEPDNISEDHPLIEDLEVTLDEKEDSLTFEDVKDTVPKLDSLEEPEHPKHNERTDLSSVLSDEPIEDKPNSDVEHRELHENDRIIREFFTMRCELCPPKTEQQFDRFLALQLHYRKQHQCRGFLRCCGKQLFRRFRVMEHIASHRGMIRCELCDRTFKSKRYQLQHVAEQHADEQESKPFRCEQCEKTFHTKRQRDAHRIAHEVTVCKLCGKTVNIRYLKKHIAQIHDAPSLAFMCDLCGKNFSSSLVLDRHIKQHQGIDTIEIVQCARCGKKLRGKYNMQKHMQRMHLEVDQVHRCEVCGHESPNSIALVYHKKRVHSGDPFACDQCGKRFKRKIYLTEHVAALHTRTPLHTCEFCEATFNSKANYYSHRKSRHTEEWEMLREERERN
ncbi:transcription factor grauzone-like [Anopheles maculipalpis]|uniref:transcription factor grauzone-like n=1 Tax=Anopheles maculipalpis TaxID=1496333 RepID=UPI00215909B6|nr:transcription factor grauzone-like [Anopheles maculipalpis]